MSFGETIFLFVLALIVFGPKKLPDIARQVGKYLNEFRRASNEFKAQIEQEIAHLEREDARKILPPSETPAGALSHNESPEKNGLDQSESQAPATLAGSASDTQIHTSSPQSPGATEAGPTEDRSAAAASQETHA